MKAIETITATTQNGAQFEITATTTGLTAKIVSHGIDLDGIDLIDDQGIQARFPQTIGDKKTRVAAYFDADTYAEIERLKAIVDDCVRDHAERDKAYWDHHDFIERNR